MLTPSASRQSAAPLFDEAALLPWFATGTPPAAITMADVVEILKAVESVYFDGQVKRGTRQFQFAFFDEAHIQNVIDQRQQM